MGGEGGGVLDWGGLRGWSVSTVAQWLACWAHNPAVLRSKLSGATLFCCSDRITQPYCVRLTAAYTTERRMGVQVVLECDSTTVSVKCAARDHPLSSVATRTEEKGCVGERNADLWPKR